MCVCACVYACVYACVSACVCVCVCACVCLCVSVCAFVCILACMRASFCEYICAWPCVRLYVRACACVWAGVWPDVILYPSTPLCARFFEFYPVYIDYFPAFRGKTTEDLCRSRLVQAHGISVMYSFTTLVENLNDPGFFNKFMVRNMRAHEGRGVALQQYEVRTTLSTFQVVIFRFSVVSVMDSYLFPIVAKVVTRVTDGSATSCSLGSRVRASTYQFGDGRKHALKDMIISQCSDNLVLFC